ncbi:UDP-2,4-diacetamido-2,4,6-trideoxy-beta-L-altropyranose hydrolase [Yoonia sp.]|uniref:UDP-2,4-diacetamido-2,4, 6-trideoxy-beta-L-altropyranose hydrolase n=1 Tax=Yoonia sp. TaxID=2212373 RepID=UPI002E0721B5|nr:UDP-2,4-diacetamido-2,4,6-trideoxy-beta-L-altropyranose hydrolase [Yoonia sp.]
MDIVFRTDASLDIGTGHVMRCMTLARALQVNGATCQFVTRALPGHMAKRIEAEGFGVTLLPAPQCQQGPTSPPAHAHWAGVSWAQDAEETLAAFGDTRPSWLVLDHYAFDARWQTAVRAASKRIMVIDDLADRPHDCDLLLDQNLGHTAYNYEQLVPDRCVSLVGPRYALLRPEFATKRASALADRATRGFRHLLITMGGIDQGDATSQVLKVVKGANLPVDLRITVIMGSQAPALDQVHALAQDMPRPTEIAVDVTNMAEHMALADLAIGAAGSTTWERCALGLPTIIVQIADNQAGIARVLSDAGAALDPGPLHAPEITQNLRAALAEAPSLLGAMAERAAYICDGDGAARVAIRLLATKQSSNIIGEVFSCG